MSRRLVFLDLETTGLDPDVHEIVEIAWATEDGPTRRLIPPHTLVTATTAALKINQYFERNLDDRRTWAAPLQLDGLRADLHDVVLAGANIRFDAAFLKRLLGSEPWHYRLLDIEAYAAGVFGWSTIEGLKDIREHLTLLGHTLPDPDHSAMRDVEVLKAIWKVLRHYSTERAVSV